MRPERGTFEHKKTTGEDYPDSKDMLDMTYQNYVRASEPRTDKTRSGAQDKEQTNDEEENKMWPRKPRRIRVPQCVKCSATMLPRNPMAAHLRKRGFGLFYYGRG